MGCKKQRPELFDMLNGRIEMGENVRVFPISNWTELDVWNYILSFLLIHASASSSDPHPLVNKILFIFKVIPSSS